MICIQYSLYFKWMSTEADKTDLNHIKPMKRLSRHNQKLDRDPVKTGMPEKNPQACNLSHWQCYVLGISYSESLSATHSAVTVDTTANWAIALRYLHSEKKEPLHFTASAVFSTVHDIPGKNQPECQSSRSDKKLWQVKWEQEVILNLIQFNFISIVRLTMAIATRQLCRNLIQAHDVTDVVLCHQVPWIHYLTCQKYGFPHNIGPLLSVQICLKAELRFITKEFNTRVCMEGVDAIGAQSPIVTIGAF